MSNKKMELSVFATCTPDYLDSGSALGVPIHRYMTIQEVADSFVHLLTVACTGSFGEPWDAYLKERTPDEIRQDVINLAVRDKVFEDTNIPTEKELSEHKDWTPTYLWLLPVNKE